MIREDTLLFISRVVDPELHILRERRDSLARQLAERFLSAERAAEDAHAAMLEVSRMARWLLHAELSGAAIGTQAARRLTVASKYSQLTNGRHV